jgi:hypothetical protein
MSYEELAAKIGSMDDRKRAYVNAISVSGAHSCNSAGMEIRQLGSVYSSLEEAQEGETYDLVRYFNDIYMFEYFECAADDAQDDTELARYMNTLDDSNQDHDIETCLKAIKMVFPNFDYFIDSWIVEDRTTNSGGGK